MLIVALTGSMGMGKSTAAARFRENGIPVFDADAEVHRLYERDAVASIEAAFPGSKGEDGIDRQRLSHILAQNPDDFKRLEAIVHPMVERARKAFLRACEEAGQPMAVVEIPLLFETGGEKAVDVVVVVGATAKVQRQRLMERTGMTPAKLDRLLERQLPDAEKRRRADFVVDTNGTIGETQAQIDVIIESLSGRAGSAFEKYHRQNQR